MFRSMVMTGLLYQWREKQVRPKSGVRLRQMSGEIAVSKEKRGV